MVRLRFMVHVALCAIADALTIKTQVVDKLLYQSPGDSRSIEDYVGDVLFILDPEDDVPQRGDAHGGGAVVTDLALMSIDIGTISDVSDTAGTSTSLTCLVFMLVAIVAIPAAYVLLCTNIAWGPEQSSDRGRKDDGNAYRAGGERLNRASYQSSDGQLSETAKNFNVEESPRGQPVASRAVSPLLLLPLCPQLVVPERSKLRCAVPKSPFCSRQDTTVTISSIPGLGSNPLFQARLAEGESLASDECGIHLESLGSAEKLAFVCTAELWDTSRTFPPKLAIMRVGRLPYATMQKTQYGDYVIACGLGTLVTFSGDYLAYDIQIINGHNQTIAQVVSNACACEYEVIVNPNIDAGLIILGLLAIDKTERNPVSDSSYW